MEEQSLPAELQSWVWLVDVERACALLIGRCLGGMLSGAPMSREERETSHWLTSHLFGSGLQPLTVDIGDRPDKIFLILKFILWIILLYRESFRMNHASVFRLLLFIKIR